MDFKNSLSKRIDVINSMTESSRTFVDSRISESNLCRKHSSARSCISSMFKWSVTSNWCRTTNTRQLPGGGGTRGCGRGDQKQCVSEKKKTCVGEIPATSYLCERNVLNRYLRRVTFAPFGHFYSIFSQTPLGGEMLPRVLDDRPHDGNVIDPGFERERRRTSE